MSEIELRLEPGTLARVLGWTAAGLSAAFVATRVLVFRFGVDPHRRLPLFFDLGREGNLPSLFGGALLLAAAALLAIASRGERAAGRPAAAWSALSGIFVFLAFDEWLSFHEALIRPIKLLLALDGVLRFAWVLPYGLFTGAVGVSCLGLLRRLPPRTRNLFLAAGTIYVAGALGCELAGGLIEHTWGRESVAWALEVLVEESLEMGGAVLFLYAIADYLRGGPAVRVSF